MIQNTPAYTASLEHDYCTAEEAVRCVQSGDRVFIHGSAATPVHLVDALQQRFRELNNVELVSITNIGELEFHDPRILTDYMTMPTRVRNIDEKLDYLIDESKQKNDLSPSLTLDHFIVDLN